MCQPDSTTPITAHTEKEYVPPRKQKKRHQHPKTTNTPRPSAIAYAIALPVCECSDYIRGKFELNFSHFSNRTAQSIPQPERILRHRSEDCWKDIVASELETQVARMDFWVQSAANTRNVVDILLTLSAYRSISKSQAGGNRIIQSFNLPA